MGLPGWILHARYFAAAPYAPISLSSCLRSNLALGLNFPQSLFLALWQPYVYKARKQEVKDGGIAYDEARLRDATLQSIKVDSHGLGKPWTRSQLLQHVNSDGLNERVHAIYLWAIAGDKDGKVVETSLKHYQEGTLLYDLSKRRQIRTDVIPFTRGGPIGVGGHSWAVKTFFDVDVYQKPKSDA